MPRSTMQHIDGQQVFDDVVGIVTELTILNEIATSKLTPKQEERIAELREILSEPSVIESVCEFVINTTVGQLAFEDCPVEQWGDYLDKAEANAPSIEPHAQTIDALGDLLVKIGGAHERVSARFEKITLFKNRLTKYYANAKRMLTVVFQVSKVATADALFEMRVPHATRILLVELEALHDVYKLRLEGIVQQKQIAKTLYDSYIDGRKMRGTPGIGLDGLETKSPLFSNRASK